MPRTRDLPISRTARAVAPLTHAHEAHDHVVFDTPSYRGSYYGHRVEIDAPPADLTPWFTRWQQAHAGKQVDRAWLCWETLDPLAPCPPLGPGDQLDRSVGLCLTGPTAGAPRTKAQPVTAEQWPQLVEAALLLPDRHDAQHYTRWFYDVLRTLPRRHTCAVWRDGSPVAAATLVDCGDEARLQDVWTAPTHQRQGLATAALHACMGAWRRSHATGPVWTAATLGGAGEALYRSLGFEAVSWCWDVGRDVL
jgi:GNAT superfamily N-acetyltransferase